MRRIYLVASMLSCAIATSALAQINPCGALPKTWTCVSNPNDNTVTIGRPMTEVVDTMNTTILSGATLRLNNYRAITSKSYTYKGDDWYKPGDSVVKNEMKSVTFSVPHIHRVGGLLDRRNYYYYVNNFNSKSFRANADNKNDLLNINIAMESAGHEVKGECLRFKKVCWKYCKIVCHVGVPDANWNKAGLVIHTVPVVHDDSIAFHVVGLDASGEMASEKHLPDLVQKAMSCFKEALLTAIQPAVLNWLNSEELQKQQADVFRLSVTGFALKATEATIKGGQLVVTYQVSAI